jgi:hypothetical protein
LQAVLSSLAIADNHLGVAQLWYAKNEQLKNIRLGFVLNVNLQNIIKIATKEGNKIIFAQTVVISLLITTLPWYLQIMSKNIACIFMLKEMAFVLDSD